MRKVVVLLGALLVAVQGFATEPCVGSWVWGSIQPQGNNLLAVRHAPGIGFVAVGSGGAVVTSPDGVTWTARSSGVTGDLLSLAYGKGLLVAVGSRGNFATDPRAPLIVTSPDGVNWTRRDRPEHDNAGEALTAVAFDGARFVATSFDAKAWVSADGIDWPATGNVMAGAERFNPDDVAWTGDRFVAVGLGSITKVEIVGTIILASPDGTTWHLEVKVDRGYRRLAVGGGRVLAYGESGVRVSTAPGFWARTRPNQEGYPTGAVWTGEKFLLLEITWQYDHPWRLLESATGSDWTLLQDSGLDHYATSLGAGGGSVVAIGEMGSIATSTDGRMFTARTTRAVAEAVDVAWTGQRYVAVGYGALLSSEDGTSWQPRPGGAGRDLEAVAAGPDLTVALGRTGEVLASPDGLTWTGHGTGVTGTFDGVDLVWAVSRFVAVGWRYDQPNGTVLTSVDGATWNRIDAGLAPPLVKVIWTGSQLVGLASSGLFTSPDGVTWTAASTRPWLAVHSLAWTGSAVVVVGAQPNCDVICCGCCPGLAASSSDLATWQVSDSLPGELFDVAWDGARLVAAGRCGLVYSSPDGLAWSVERGMGSWLEQAAVAAAGRSVAVVGPQTLLGRAACHEPGTLRRRLPGGR
jgi:hypothetical protein